MSANSNLTKRIENLETGIYLLSKELNKIRTELYVTTNEFLSARTIINNSVNLYKRPTNNTLASTILSGNNISHQYTLPTLSSTRNSDIITSLSVKNKPTQKSV